MTRKIIFICALLMLFATQAVFAGIPMKVNNRDAQEGQTLIFSKDDLDGGKLIFSTPADADTASAEISLDNGRHWDKMEREAGIFVYKHRPRDDEKMVVVFMLRKTGGGTSIRSTNAVIYYQKSTPKEAVGLVLEKMRNAYEAEQKGRFMDLFSMRFPDKIKFEESIQNDFFNYNNIRLFYKIDRESTDSDGQGAIWNVHWERKYMDRNGNNFSDSANIAMKFDKEMDRWLISAMNGNTMFGSSLLASPDLTVATSDISNGYVGIDYVINAVIHNRGSAAANNVPVRFDYSGGLTGTETITTIAANSTATVTHNFGPIVPVPGVDIVRITIDPNNTISEGNEGNNVATKTL